MVAALRVAKTDRVVERPIQSCTQYSLPVDAQPSGGGNLWEYYHFMIDFAPSIYYHIRNDKAPCKKLYVPGWSDQDMFALTLRNQPLRSMHDNFDFFLGKPFGLTIELVGTREAMQADMAERRLIDWNCHSEDRQWANQPAIYFTEFRDYARALPGITPVMRDVIAVERKKVQHYDQHYDGPSTGADRRHLSKEFYDRLLQDAATNGLNTSVVALEHKTAAQQIALFSNVKVIIAQHGAALSNMIFAHKDTLIIEIGHRYYPCYETLSHKLGLHYLHHEGTFYANSISSEVTDRIHQDKAFQEIRAIIQHFGRDGSAAIDCPSFSKCVGAMFGR